MILLHKHILTISPRCEEADNLIKQIAEKYDVRVEEDTVSVTAIWTDRAIPGEEE